MKTIILILSITVLLTACSNQSPNLVVVENNYEIDLTDIDSVKSYLNGFWMLYDENNASKRTSFLDVNTNREEIEWKIVESETGLFFRKISRDLHQPMIRLIRVRDSISIKATDIGGVDTLAIDYLSKTRLILDGNTYYKHKRLKM